MFANQSLKKRFKSLETKLADLASDSKGENSATLKTMYPEIHSQVKSNDAEEEGLSYYLRSIKKSFNRVQIKEASQENLDLENEFSSLILGFTKNPCFIQINHPQDKKGLENFKLMISALKESDSQWRLLLRDLRWVGISFSGSTTTLSFDQLQIEVNKLEGLLKTISTKSNYVLSFNIQKKDEQIMIGLRLEANTSKQISNVRNTAL